MDKKTKRISKYITQQIERHDWVWFWSGNWPLLDSLMEIDLFFQKAFKRITGIQPVCTVAFFRGGITTVYHSKQNYERLRHYFHNCFQKDPSFMSRYYDKYDERMRLIINRIERIMSYDLSRKSNSGLIRLWEQKRRLYSYNAVMDFIAWYMEFFFTPVLQSWVKQRLEQIGKSDELASVIALLVTPRKASEFYYEQQSIFRLVSFVLRHRRLKRAFLSSASPEEILSIDRKFAKAVRMHHKKYCWVSMLVNNPETSITDIISQISLYVRDSKVFQIESRRLGDNYQKSDLRKKEKWIRRLQPDSRMLSLIASLEETAYARTKDNAYQGRLTYLTKPLYLEVARRLGISYSELKECRDEEIITYLKKGKYFPKKLIRKRLQLSCMIGINGKVYVYEGEKAALVEKIVVKRRKSQRPSRLTGTPASTGRKIRGRVRICLSSKDAGQLLAGEILVAPATSADFVPAMRKARAIITEFGGLTSHAAIVSRELGIPCIVGTKVATQVLKDGDLVEVDAERGIVRRLKEKHT